MPLTAVMGRYDPDDPLPEDDGGEEEYVRQQEATVLDGPADLYLHTNAASLLYKSIREKGSVRVCVTSTKGIYILLPPRTSPDRISEYSIFANSLGSIVDGVVLFFTPNGHSLNYRSAILHGDASLVSDPAEKRYAMHLLTNHMSRRRWSATNPVSPAAMKSVQVMRVRVRSASAKIRAANVGEFEPQLAMTAAGPREDVWTGVVPVYEVLGEPVGSGVFPERTVQGQVEEWRVGRNEREKSYAERVAQPSEVEVKMRELVLQS